MTSRRAGSRTGTDNFLPQLFLAAAVCLIEKSLIPAAGAVSLPDGAPHGTSYIPEIVPISPRHVRLMGFARLRITTDNSASLRQFPAPCACRMHREPFAWEHAGSARVGKLRRDDESNVTSYRPSPLTHPTI